MNAGTLVAELPTLFDDLERAGFEVTVQSRLAVHDLLLRLTVEGGLPSDDDTLRRMIGPIVCTSPSEQQQFALLFQQWQENVSEPAESSDQAAMPSGAGTGQVLSKRQKKGRPILTGCVIAAVIALGMWINDRRFEEDRPSVDLAPMSQLNSTDDQPEPDPTLEGNSQDKAEDPTFDQERDDQQVPEEETREKASTDTLADNDSDAEGAPDDQTGGDPVETETPPMSQEQVSAKPRFGLAAAVTGIGLLLSGLTVCAWWALAARWRKRFLVKRSVNRDPDVEQLAVQCSSRDSRLGTSLIRTAQRFRQHLSRSSHRLDIGQTAARTAANGGLFTPVRAEQKVSPSYLMLIESDGRRDQQTQMIDNLIDQLESEGVSVSRYYFRGDPRICRRPGGRAQKLAELAASHNSDRLMVFGDAKSFLDPMTGGVSPWVEAFESWPERALMVAAESDSWSAAEATMSEHFRLGSANSAGLSSLVDCFTPDPALRPSVGNDRFPAMLREHPERWLDREAPSQDSLNKLVEQLRAYLGDAGYQWLSACAVYPTLHNRLTVWTGESMTDEHNRPMVNDSDLMRLSRLPWLRQGQLPDWLRARLIADLSGEQELAIRSRLDHLFRSAVNRLATDASLPIARKRCFTQSRPQPRSTATGPYVYLLHVQSSERPFTASRWQDAPLP